MAAAGGGWWDSPPPSPPLLSDAVDEEGSPFTREEVEEVLGFVNDTYDAWRNKEWPGKKEKLAMVGTLNFELVLDPMMLRGEWRNAAGYLRRVFGQHQTEAQAVGAAVPNKDHQTDQAQAVVVPNKDHQTEEEAQAAVVPSKDHQTEEEEEAQAVGASDDQHQVWELRRAHPELYMLPRVQLALELASRGDLVASRLVLNDLEQVVVWTTANSSQRHGAFLGDMIQRLRNALQDGGGASPVTHDEVIAGRNRTATSIRQYLYVYLPAASGRRDMPGAGGDWQFAQRNPDNRKRRYICFLCHREQSGDLYHVREHIAHFCPASTQSVRSRLQHCPPRVSHHKKRKMEHHGDGAGPSSHGGGGGPPGAGAAAVGAA